MKLTELFGPDRSTFIMWLTSFPIRISFKTSLTASRPHAPISRPGLRDGPTPNDRSRGPPRTREDDRVDEIRQNRRALQTRNEERSSLRNSEREQEARGEGKKTD